METRAGTKIFKLNELFIPSRLNTDKLSTYTNVLQFYLLKEEELGAGKYAGTKYLSKVVATEVLAIWNQLPIETVSLRTFECRIEYHVNKYKKLQKTPECRRFVESVNQKIEKFFTESEQLFDIAVCLCNNDSTCSNNCKTPLKIKMFLQDQRSKREKLISTLRPVRPQLRISTDTPPTLDSSLSSLSPACADTSSGGDTESQGYQIAESSRPSTNQMRVKLPHLILAMDRCGISVSHAAMIANAVLQDFNIITPNDTSMVIDKSKIQRERQIFRDQEQARSYPDLLLTGLYFDGRKDLTCIQEKLGDKFYRKEVTEEHVTILQEPGSKYLGHITPTSGTASCISKTIQDFLVKNEIDVSKIDAIGCDGTPVNTGRKNGIIRQLESKFNKPLHWFICQLHGNELILRHLFEALDGRKTGPVGFTGLISKQLKNCEQLEVCDFVPITTELPNVDSADLSKDQQYLIEISRAVVSGDCSEDLARRNPGAISHSRWLTTANRLLRLYVGTSEPSDKLKCLVEVIIKVYVPIWFRIKKYPLCFEGPRHLWETISLTRNLTDAVKEIIDPVIQRNAYFAHPENILLSMLVDERLDVRINALNKILTIRRSSTNEMRTFEVPKQNFEATDYTELISWDVLSEPPLTKHFSDCDLKNVAHVDQTTFINNIKFPCHTQAVERHIALVTRVSKQVCGYNARESCIRNTLESRSTMPTFETKRDFQM